MWQPAFGLMVFGQINSRSSQFKDEVFTRKSMVVGNEEVTRGGGIEPKKMFFSQY